MSDRSVYAIASGKGGVGKTTTAINLGAMLADRGHEVVVVDTDLGMANLADFLDFDIGSPTLQEVLAGDADVETALHEAPGGIDVLPSAPDIEAFVRSKPANLDGVVADLREEYDYVLLDTGAGVSYDVLVPMALADGVLLVATPDVASVRDTAKTGELAERVETEVVGAVLTQRSSDILTADDVEETLGTDVLAVIPEDEAVPMGIDAGRPLAAFAPNAPAGRAYRDLTAVLTGETDPDPELDLDDGDVDVEFDADPPERHDATGANAGQQADEELAPDSPGTEEAAESVREAIRDDDSGGLLGGELSKAAEEIRAEARQSADESPADPRAGDRGRDAAEARADAAGAGVGPAKETDVDTDRTGETDVDTDRTGETDVDTDRTGETDVDTHGTDDADTHGTGETDADTGETDDADWPGDGKARSVDDLLDEHLGGGIDDFGDETDDFGDETDDFGDETGDFDDDRDDFESADSLGSGRDDRDDAGRETDAFDDADDLLADAEEDADDHGEESAGSEGTASGEREVAVQPGHSDDGPGASADAPTETGVPFEGDNRRDPVGHEERNDTGREERSDVGRAGGRPERRPDAGPEAARPREEREKSAETVAEKSAETPRDRSAETAEGQQSLDADIPNPDRDRDDDRDDDTVLDRLGSLFR